MIQKLLITHECVGEDLPYEAIEEWEQEMPTHPSAPITMWSLVKGPPRVDNTNVTVDDLVKRYVSDRRIK